MARGLASYVSMGLSFLDLDDNTSLYSCGESKLKQLQNGRLCSRFKLEESPRDDLTKYLKSKVEEKLSKDDFYTYWWFSVTRFD